MKKTGWDVKISDLAGFEKFAEDKKMKMVDVNIIDGVGIDFPENAVNSSNIN